MPFPPSAASDACAGDALVSGAVPSDSEMLDMLDMDVRLSTFLQASCHTSQAPAPTAQPSAETDAVMDGGLPAAPPPSFLIGGSLFAPRPASMRLRSSNCQRGAAAVTDASITTASVFCPFTHQYVSLYSPHWARLEGAGFGISSGRRGAPRVVLRFAQLLRPYAQALQACCKAESGTAAHRREHLYASWQWSAGLRRTLGDILLAVPTHSTAALAAAVEAELQTRHNYRALRVMPEYLTERAPAGAASAAWQARLAALQLPQERREAPASAAVLEWAAQPENTSPPSSGPASSLPGWLGQYTARPTLPLLGLPPSVHAAFLELPLPRAADAEAQMARACVALLTRLSQDAAALLERGAVEAPPRLYYCPLAHGVDYSGVLDLFAFRVPPDFGAAQEAGAAPATLASLCADAASATPVLSLGLEGSEAAASAPPLRVVVFGGAHLLSKRAVSRLLDQWTRNGSAARRWRDVGGRGRSAQRDRSGWRTLLGSRVGVGDVLPHLRTLAAPYGDVQAVFLSHQPCREAPPAAMAAEGPPRVAQGRRSPAVPSPAQLAVCAAPRSDLLFIEEALSAALLRVSGLYRHLLSPEQRRELVQSLLRSVLLRRAGGDVQMVKVAPGPAADAAGKTGPPSYPLSSPKGQALFHEACEAVLTLVSPLDAFLHTGSSIVGATDRTVGVLATYPILSSLRVRHTLLSAYALCLSDPGGAEAGERAAPPRTRVTFVPSRRSAEERESAERALLQRVGRCRAASASARTVADAAPASQTYAVYVEPPVLAGGGWTATLLFCAPSLADVVALRTILLHMLRRRAAHHGGGAWEPGSRGVVEDVDIFHADAADSTPWSSRGYRVFGVRALACPADRSAAAPLRDLQQHLQWCLKVCASTALCFPLWTYRDGGPAAAASPSAARVEGEEGSGAAGQRERHAPRPPFRYAVRRTGGGGGGDAHPSRRLVSFPDFAAVKEWRVHWTPAVVERRLLTLAAAQRPRLALTRGSRVVLLRELLVPDGTPSGAVALPRGAVCTVVDFVPVSALLSEPSAAASGPALPPVVRRQVEAMAEESRRQLLRYVEQQQHASALPLLRCLRDMHARPGGPPHFDQAFLLAPQPSLVGGYRSTHYYAMPVLHLPVHVVVGTRHSTAPGRGQGTQRRSSDEVQPRVVADSDTRRSAAPQSRPFLRATAPHLSLDVCLPSVYHPYHADSTTSRAAVCLTTAERAAAMQHLFAHMESSGAAPDGEASRPGDAARLSHSPISFMEDVLFYEAAEAAGEEAPRTPTPGSAVDVVGAPAIVCPLLTELALFARGPVPS